MVLQLSQTWRGSESPGGTRSATLAPHTEQKFSAGEDMRAYDTAARIRPGSSFSPLMTWSGATPSASTGAPVRLIQKVRKPKALAPEASQQLLDTKPIADFGTRSFSTASRYTAGAGL